MAVTSGERPLFQLFHVLAVDSPLGKVWIESDGELITRVSFESLKTRHARPPAILLDAGKQLQAYFRRRRKHFDLPLQQLGTPFQKLVWQAIGDIRWGDTRSYQEISERIGGKAVARTVGNATGANPLPIIVPCHRVIGSTGMLTGYIGGIWRKRWLLSHEGALPGDLFSYA